MVTENSDLHIGDLGIFSLLDLYQSLENGTLRDNDEYEALARALGVGTVRSQVEFAILDIPEEKIIAIQQAQSVGSSDEALDRHDDGHTLGLQTLLSQPIREATAELIELRRELEIEVLRQEAQNIRTPFSLVRENTPFAEADLANQVEALFDEYGFNKTGLGTMHEIVSDFEKRDRYAQPVNVPELKGVMDAMNEGALDTEESLPVVAIKSGGSNLDTIVGQNSLGGKFQMEHRSRTQLNDSNRRCENTDEFWELFISDEIIEWIEATGENPEHEAIPVAFTPAFPIEYMHGDYKIVHCSGKHDVPNFAPVDEAHAMTFDRESQPGIIESLKVFLGKRLKPEVFEKVDIHICPNDTFAAGGMTHEGGIIDGTGGNIAIGKINMECGQYRGFRPTLLDHLVSEFVDDSNINFEWLFSGKYMYQYLRESVKLMLGDRDPLLEKLNFLNSTENNIIISDIVYKDDFDIDSLGGEGVSFTKSEKVLIKAVSTQIMHRAVEAVAQISVATSRYNTIKSRGAAPDQYELGGDGSLILNTPDFVAAINARIDELVTENCLQKPVSIVPFKANEAAEYIGDGESFTIDATGNGTAQFAIASHLYESSK